MRGDKTKRAPRVKLAERGLTARVYSYGAKAPTLNYDLAIEQMRLAHRYRNHLVEIERARRLEHDLFLEEVCPELAEIEGHIEKIDRAIFAAKQTAKRTNAAARKRVATVNTATLREARKVLRAERKELRDALFAEHGGSLRAIDEKANEQRKQARAECGVHWGTYLLIEEAARNFHKGPPPRFRPWRGGGRVGVHLCHGMTVARALSGEDTRLRIRPVPSTTLKHYVAWLRIGSEGRAPVWCAAPIVLHRPLPADGAVKKAWLQRLCIGPREEWRLQVVVQFPREEASKPTGTGAVAVNVGWRLFDDRLRVATWLGHDGDWGELAIPLKELGRWRRRETLQATRDVNFNAMRAGLLEWLGEDARPTWLVEATARLAQWRSPSRLRRVARRWADERFAGDEAIFAGLAAWRKQDLHLHLWQESTLIKALRWRENLYRVFAARLREKYGTLIVDDADHRQFHRGKSDNETARYDSRVAAAASLRLTLTQSLPATIHKGPATQRCHACGEFEPFDAAARVEHTCSHCGARWDQDCNACEVMLRVYDGRLASMKAPQQGPEDARD